MRVFFSAGEPSGDHHAAVLVQELRARDSSVECVGLGGPRMAAAGCLLVADLTQLAVMWFLRVLLNLHKFWGLAMGVALRAAGHGMWVHIIFFMKGKLTIPITRIPSMIPGLLKNSYPSWGRL